MFFNDDQYQETSVVLFISGLFLYCKQQSIKHSLIFTDMVFQFSYFTIYISAQQFAQVDPVSGTSGVGLTTSQQDHSAKKKPKKSNNENEGDVSTILQKSYEIGTIKILNISMMYLYTEFRDIVIYGIL